MPNLCFSRPRSRPADSRTDVRVALAAVVMVFSALLLVACVRGSLPAKELYRLRPASAAATATDGDATDGRAPGAAVSLAVPLVVEPYVTSGIYGSPQLVYRVDDVRYGTYPNREWAVPLGSLLSALTVETLRREPATGGRVDDMTSPPPDDALVWRGIVREFEEINRGKLVFAGVRLEAALVRARDDSVLWRGDARVERPVVPPTLMSAVVDSLSSAATQAVRQLARGAEPALRAAAAQLTQTPSLTTRP